MFISFSFVQNYICFVGETSELETFFLRHCLLHFVPCLWLIWRWRMAFVKKDCAAQLETGGSQVDPHCGLWPWCLLNIFWTTTKPSLSTQDKTQRVSHTPSQVYNTRLPLSFPPFSTMFPIRLLPFALPLLGSCGSCNFTCACVSEVLDGLKCLVCVVCSKIEFIFIFS